MTSNVLFQRGTHGSRERYIRNLYAYRVAAVMAGAEGMCPCCGEAFYVDNDAEVDRTYPRENYIVGEIVYVCSDCNQDRANGEWEHVETYRADVRAASARVTIPSGPEARAWWADRPRKPRRTNKYR